MSPWVDLTSSGESISANDGKDAILRANDLPRHAKAYAGGLDLADPRLSPMYADLAGLPPTLIQCGDEELFLSEASRARLAAGGGGKPPSSCRCTRRWGTTSRRTPG